MPRVFIHLPQHQLKDDLSSAPGFYGHLARAFAGLGWQVEQRRRRSIEAGPEFAEPGHHFVHQGLVRQANVLNTGIAYILPFWYADPHGIFGESSIFDLAFDPASVPLAWADGFHRRLTDRLVSRRTSRHDQPDARAVFAPGAIAVFLQGPSIPMARVRYMSEPDMVRMILEGAGGREVLVKPHPRNPDPGTLAELRGLARSWPNLKLVDANLHDMLTGAAACCSISSSVGIEAMLHKVPAIQFGRTDFHHCAVTVRPGDSFAEALGHALATDWPFSRYLYWFLQRQCLNMGQDGWFDRLLERMEVSPPGQARQGPG